MGRRNKVEKLPETEFDFVIRAVTNGRTDREISAEFEAAFGSKLDKNSINRWRSTVGEELADRYKLARFQAKQLREDLALEDADDYQNVIKNIEERLLTATREVVRQDPVKLLMVRQQEEKMRLKRDEIELKQKQLEFDRERHKGAIDRLKVGAETMTDFLEYVESDAEAVGFLTRHLKPFGEFLKAKYAAQ
jgi:hypothetical protein